MLTEWGYRTGPGEVWDGDQTSFGEPLKAFAERRGLSWTAWCADNLWEPAMFDSDWVLRRGPTEMGGFVQAWLREKQDLDQPVRD